jgi:Ran GTPase-activating protein (RanGAP) involved in mRNA processing and transport
MSQEHGCDWAEYAVHSLERLDLSDNPLTSEVAEELAAAIKAQTCLKELVLNDTSLGDEGVIVLAEALPSTASSLEVLQLALNEVYTGHYSSLFSAMRWH